MLTIYKRQKINKATAKWIGLFTDFYNNEGRLPTEEEMSIYKTKESKVAFEIVAERIKEK